MQVRKLGNNETLIVKDAKLEILFSYSTPVAARVGDRYYKTDQYYSRTTSKHINRYLGGINAQPIDQAFLNNLA